MPYVRKIDKSGLRELRIRHSSNLIRIFYFAVVGKKFILLHGILKKEERIPRAKIEIATKRMNDHLSRS
jgi:phage-related protein